MSTVSYCYLLALYHIMFFQLYFTTIYILKKKSNYATIIFTVYFTMFAIYSNIEINDWGTIMNLQESGEMYLETIHILTKKSSTVRSIDVCEYMGFSKPSVSRAVNLLKDNGYVEIDGSGYLSLTASGKEVAEKIYERHNILTKFLTQLGVSPEVASEDACKMEHYISDESFDAIKQQVNN